MLAVVLVALSSACAGGRRAARTAGTEQTSLVSETSTRPAVAPDTASDVSDETDVVIETETSEQDLTGIESDLAGIDGDLAELDADLREADAELNRSDETDVN